MTKKLLMGLVSIVIIVYALWLISEDHESYKPGKFALDSWISIEDIEPDSDRASYIQSLELLADGKHLDAVPTLLDLARDGVVEAQLVLGTMYTDGHGIQKDLDEAARWHNRAKVYLTKRANAGDVEAQYQLGLLYFDGVGVDIGETVPWIIKAARKGHPGAQYLLAKYNSFSRESHSKEHIKWMKESATNGYAPAQHALGVLFTRGDALPKDDSQAKHWFDLAREQGYVPEPGNPNWCSDGPNPAHLVLRKNPCGIW